jgi:hypothetical protein
MGVRKMNINIDKSIRILLLVIISSFLIISSLIAQTDIPAGNVSGTWALSGSPFRVNGEIAVPDSQTLIIEPGVNVVFTGHYKFNVQGRLLAIGTVSDSISFTAQDPSVGWHSLRFINTPSTNDTSKIVYCSLKCGKANTGSDLDRCGGAISIKDFSKIQISNCLIESNMQSGNMSTTGGGGIALGTASPIITNCEFKSNTGVYGAAMAIYYSSNALIMNNHFHGNIGHGLINIGVSSASVFMNNLIENNTSTGLAHGILHFEGGSSKAIFINNTIVNNDCGGGAIWESDGSAPLFFNNIIYGNKPAQVNLAAPSALNFIHCLIEGGRNGFTGSAFNGTYQNCIDSVPLFVSSNDFHLQNTSPCIGTGADSIQVSSKWYYAPDYDYDGNAKPNPEGTLPDIGAFENSLGNPITGVNEMQKQIPDGFQLYQNYPNPFNPSTMIEFHISKSGLVTLIVYDLLGREVKTLVNEEMKPGSYQSIFNGSSVASGVYLYRLQTNGFVQSKKFVLLK